NLALQLNVIGVAASNRDRRLALINPSGPPLSNYGRPYVQLLAPGVDISVPTYAGGDRTESGSSFAAPLVSAAAAILLEDNVPSVVKARLIYTAEWLPEADRATLWGGHLNFGRAVGYPDVTMLTYPGNSDVEHGISVENQKDEFIELKDDSG